MSRIIRLYRENKLYEAKEALLERADAVAGLLLNIKKGEYASNYFSEAEATKKSKPKSDKITVDGNKAKPKRKIKFEFTEESEKKK